MNEGNECEVIVKNQKKKKRNENNSHVWGRGIKCLNQKIVVRVSSTDCGCPGAKFVTRLAALLG
jgi:hypothetical protein